MPKSHLKIDQYDQAEKTSQQTKAGLTCFFPHLYFTLFCWCNCIFCQFFTISICNGSLACRKHRNPANLVSSSQAIYRPFNCSKKTTLKPWRNGNFQSVLLVTSKTGPIWVRKLTPGLFAVFLTGLWIMSIPSKILWSCTRQNEIGWRLGKKDWLPDLWLSNVYEVSPSILLTMKATRIRLKKGAN